MPIYAIVAALVLVLAPVLPGLLGEDFWNPAFQALAFAALIAALIQKRARPSDLSERLLLIFLTMAALSIPCGVIMRHQGPAFLGDMLRGLAQFCAYGSIFYVCRRAVADGTTARMIVLIGVVAGALWVSGDGVQNYLFQLRLHQGSWREFATFTDPDFLAGYLVITAPITLGLLLAAPRSPSFYLGFGVCFLLQLATVVTTQSRFAVVSTAVSFVVFAAAALRGRRIQAIVSKKLLAQIGAGAAVFVAAVSVLAKPLIARFAHPAQNSTDFRIWTWRGTLHMIEAHPILGSGVGSYIDAYPAFALTGFTRHAHDAYLQIAAECGIPALFVLMAFLGAVGGRAWGALEIADEGGPWNRRFILAGAIAALAAGLVQNLIDSDVYVLPCGLLLFAASGLCSGIATQVLEQVRAEAEEPEQKTPSRRNRKKGDKLPERTKTKAAPWKPVEIGLAAGSFVLLIYCGAEALAAWNGEQALTAANPNDAAADYQAAMQLAPFDSVYPMNLGYLVIYSGQNNAILAEPPLRQAVRLDPGEQTYKRLAEDLDAQGRPADACAVLDQGLIVAPTSLDLLLARAEYSPPDEQADWYEKIADLQMTPVGQVRAIDLTEPKYAIADAYLENAAYESGDYKTAALYGRRAFDLVNGYFGEGGSKNAIRAAANGGQPNPADDARYKALQTTIAEELIASQKALSSSTPPAPHS